ncbi:MAG: hydroxyacid dehydrogenase [Thermoanaerobaculum sp.]|nr:hydroxyacid dehydrogenase [Thermoanaerobaculum sp.]MDW7968502.1 hydroxyacid dehydrogenase [Thermoanaerobaculum sp.]
MLILICDAFDPSLPEKLQRFGQVTEDVGRLPEAEVALVRSKTKCTADWMEQARKLKLIIRGGVGMDNIDLEAAKARGIRAVNTPKASAVAVAELTMALMLAMPNRLVEAHNSTKEGKFLKKELKRTELFGKTLGLVGIGNIGHEVAVRARAFGMRVLAYDPYVKKSDSALLVASLKELLPQSDYVSLHVPLTEETKGLINKQTIALMKDGAYLINTGRGKCVVEEDVAEALRTGKLAGYATDVYASEPPEPTSPLLSAPNTLLTPHIGASSKENLLRIGEEVVKLLEEYTGKRA